MKHIIDLHGKTHKEAVKLTESFLVGASFTKPMYAEVITGKSKAMQDTIIDEVIKPFNFSYYIPADNLGVIIVTDNLL
jgi:DNA-nicking Smr family endonuclease